MELQVPLNSRKILKKKNKLGGLTLPGFKTFYKTTVIGADRTTGRENGTAGPALQPGADARPISGKTAEGEQESFRQCWQGWVPARTSTNADPHADYLSQVKNLNAKAKAMKLLQKKREQTFIISDLALASRYDATSVSNKGENR